MKLEDLKVIDIIQMPQYAFHRTYLELKQVEEGEKVETIMVKKEEDEKGA